MRIHPMRARLAVLAATLVAFAPPAQAHDTLLSSTPADGDRLETPPDEVVLTFSADPIDVGGEVLVVDTDGTSWADSEPEYSGREVTVGLDPDMPDGDFEIRWRVVSSDGHPIQGVIEFELDSGSGANSTSSEDEGSAPSDGPAGPTDDPAAPSAGASTDPSDSPEDADQADRPDQTDQAGTDDEGSSVPWRPIAVAAGGALLAGLVYAAVLLLRREPRESAPATPTRDRDGSDS
ncbi:Copper resistance protein CopC [Actinomycetales bacterium JB111]|nr:Copper resistance protein CopC [Actinomycetales bacterium JB111]